MAKKKPVKNQAAKKTAKKGPPQGGIRALKKRVERALPHLELQPMTKALHAARSQAAKAASDAWPGTAPGASVDAIRKARGDVDEPEKAAAAADDADAQDKQMVVFLGKPKRASGRDTAVSPGGIVIADEQEGEIGAEG
jgi:hypothetical protein